jgi:hypothetical protein
MIAYRIFSVSALPTYFDCKETTASLSSIYRLIYLQHAKPSLRFDDDKMAIDMSDKMVTKRVDGVGLLPTSKMTCKRCCGHVCEIMKMKEKHMDACQKYEEVDKVLKRYFNDEEASFTPYS